MMSLITSTHWRWSATSRSRTGPGWSSSSLAAATNTHPPGNASSWSQASQRSKMARMRHSPRGFLSAGRTTSSVKRAAAYSSTWIWSASLDRKWAKSPLLESASSLGEGADGETTETDLAGEAGGVAQDESGGWRRPWSRTYNSTNVRAVNPHSPGVTSAVPVRIATRTRTAVRIDRRLSRLPPPHVASRVAIEGGREIRIQHRRRQPLSFEDS